MRRRIWTELLPPEGLGDERTIALLRRFGLEPIVAMPPSRESEPMFEALRRLQDASVPVGVWPLLEDEDGYWPCLENHKNYETRVMGLVESLTRRGLSVRTVAVDLEPPLYVTKAFFRRGGSVTMIRRASGALSRRSRTAWHEAERCFSRIQSMLRERGIESVAAFYPPLAFDLASSFSLFGRALGTPGANAGWDALSPMLYSSVIEQLIPFSKRRLSRRLFEATARALVKSSGSKAAISIGLVAEGKLGDEPTLQSPDDLAFDVSLARRWGINDLALFSLEGILSKENPDAWLRAFAAEI